jgi:hypothetical protein
MNFPIVSVKSVEDIDNHMCIRVDDIKVCTCIFQYNCLKCGKNNKRQTIAGAKNDILNGCSSCSKKNIKGKKTYTKINQNPVGGNRGSLNKAIGNVGEHIVARELFELDYKVYIGYTTNEKDFDLLVEHKETRNVKKIQVKVTSLNHNDYASYNGKVIYHKNQGQSNFDFLIGYMLNYNLFYIIPVLDLESVFLAPQIKKPIERWKVSVKLNWLHKYNLKSKAKPYLNAWHLIEKALS